MNIVLRYFGVLSALGGLGGAAFAQEVHLICGGAGTAVKTSSSNAFGSTSNGESATATIVTRRDRDFADQVDVELDGNAGRIRLPRTMLPMLRGGKEGWFQLKNLKISDRAITANAAVNFMNNPKVHIDRVTGSISISGKNGDFSGQCEAFDPATMPKKF